MDVSAVPNVAVRTALVRVTCKVDSALPGTTQQNGGLAYATPKLMAQLVALLKLTRPPKSVDPVSSEKPVQAFAVGWHFTPLLTGAL